MNKEGLVDELVDHAKKIGVVSVEARQAQSLLRELKWDGRKQPNGKPWKPETMRYRRGLLIYRRKLTSQVEFHEEMISKCRKRLIA